jgi:DNA-directed RNA polymerase subunit RPC12/RpoP
MAENRRSQNVEKLDLPPVHELKCVQNLLGGSQCVHCELIFSSEVELSAHLFPDKEIIKCPKCSSKFLTTRGMKQHFGKKHSKIRPYLCQICSKRFRSFYGARIHREQVHFKSARMNCNHCGKSVFNRYSLARHYKVCRNYSSD